MNPENVASLVWMVWLVHQVKEETLDHKVSKDLKDSQDEMEDLVETEKLAALVMYDLQVTFLSSIVKQPLFRRALTVCRSFGTVTVCCTWKEVKDHTDKILDPLDLARGNSTACLSYTAIQTTYASMLQETINLTGCLHWRRSLRNQSTLLLWKITLVDALFARPQLSLLLSTANLQKTQYVLLDGQAYGLATVLSCTLLLGVVVAVKPSPVRDRACKISEPLRSSNATERKDTATIIITNTVSG